MSSDPLQQRAIKVIKPLIPRDAKERVQRAFRQWNQIIREHIRNETALRLIFDCLLCGDRLDTLMGRCEYELVMPPIGHATKL